MLTVHRSNAAPVDFCVHKTKSKHERLLRSVRVNECKDLLGDVIEMVTTSIMQREWKSPLGVQMLEHIPEWAHTSEHDLNTGVMSELPDSSSSVVCSGSDAYSDTASATFDRVLGRRGG